MPLKIFISSVSREFSSERQALHEEIQKLQDLFVGMELFGSEPSKPADYSARKVEESDLYVGLFGEKYGSIDEATGLSFTHLEYQAAAGKIPCLIYFKGGISDSAETNSSLATLKDTLRQRHIVYPFKDLGDLKLQFLVDFIKLLRADLFDKIVPIKRGAIPAQALLSLSKGFIGEQIRSVGQDKFISELYVAREAEKEVARFTNFEEMFRVTAATILEHLESISMLYDLGDEAALAFSQAKVAFLGNAGSESAQSALDQLKRAFYFREVDNAIEEVNSLIMEVSDDRFDLGVRAFQARFSGKPFISSVRLADLYKGIFHERFRSSRKKKLQTDLSYRELLELFPAHEDKRGRFLANDLLRDLTRQIERGLRRCLVLVDKAGTGKTNIACRLAEQLAGQHPVVLLSGQMELSSEYDIEFHIQQRLESAFSGIFSDWMNRVSPSLQEAGKWLFIIIDGINESSKRPLLIKLLKDLLPRLEARRIKLILTCRDLFWDIFRDALGPYLFEDVVPLHEFSESEWEHAVAAYFKRFDVECTLDKEAREALRNPLLLRFFCEAHRGQRLGRVSNLRLVSMFDVYIKRTGVSISERHASLKPESVLTLLIGVARKMWKIRSTSVNPVSVGVGPQASDDDASVYNLVVSENIILEEASHAYSVRKSVRFLYDEFMEYMVARSWVDEISEAIDERAATTKLVQEAVDSLGTFPPALGAVLFLDQMLERRGSIVNDFIQRASMVADFLLDTQQTSLVYAFESINFSNADDQLIAAVQKFEPNVREDLRERLARVILKILEARPDHPYARQYVHQVLEVDHDGKHQPADEITLGPRFADIEVTEWRDWAETSKGGWPDEPDSVRSRWPKESSSPGFEPVKRKSKLARDTHRLPPARYHYSEETKINAIGILVQMRGSRHDYEVIGEGIRQLGRTDLHSALQALEYIDLARDDLVYKTVASYINMGKPEYRIYCAWLLRDRYGSSAASYLARLLTDVQTRVHEYPAQLFETRLIEEQLVEELLRRLSGGKDLKRWQLSHFIRLLRKRLSFHPPELSEIYGSRIVNTLTALQNHQHPSIRLEVYRALIEYPSFVSLETLRMQMQQDSDIYVGLMAEKLNPPR